VDHLPPERLTAHATTNDFGQKRRVEIERRKEITIEN
jgi:hypothetical protein